VSRGGAREALARFIRSESGATAIEYGLNTGLISIVIITAAATVGRNLDRTFDNVARAL
jgi:pilus assembly protein Flp/PilA